MQRPPLQATQAHLPVARHHAQYSSILALRHTSETLDKQIKSMVILLSDTRKQLLAVPSHAALAGVHQVKVDDVLSYARFISKTTVPPTNSSRDGLDSDELSSKIIKSSNAVATGASTADELSAPTPIKSEQETTTSAVNQEAKAMLDPVSKLPFVPWPTQEVICTGALGAIQGMVERGQDPGQVTTSNETDETRRAEAEASAQQRAKVEEEELSARAQGQKQTLVHMGGADAGRHAPEDDVFNPDD